MTDALEVLSPPDVDHTTTDTFRLVEWVFTWIYRVLQLLLLTYLLLLSSHK